MLNFPMFQLFYSRYIILFPGSLFLNSHFTPRIIAYIIYIYIQTTKITQVTNLRYTLSILSEILPTIFRKAQHHSVSGLRPENRRTWCFTFGTRPNLPRDT
jgi:hypothetical protein